MQEVWLTCSVASEVAAVVAENAIEYLDAPIKRVGALDVPSPFAPNLENFVLPNPEKVAAAVRELF